jgi:CBS domain-containing protein
MSSTPKFAPYANEADVVEVGRLMLENRLDRITVSGDVDLTADKDGLAQARLLHDLLGRVVAALEARDLPDRLPPPDVKTVANPFG